jgi:hypothetical protein
MQMHRRESEYNRPLEFCDCMFRSVYFALCAHPSRKFEQKVGVSCIRDLMQRVLNDPGSSWTTEWEMCYNCMYDYIVSHGTASLRLRGNHRLFAPWVGRFFASDTVRTRQMFVQLARYHVLEMRVHCTEPECIALRCFLEAHAIHMEVHTSLPAMSTLSRTNESMFIHLFQNERGHFNQIVDVTAARLDVFHYDEFHNALHGVGLGRGVAESSQLGTFQRSSESQSISSASQSLSSESQSQSSASQSQSSASQSQSSAAQSHSSASQSPSSASQSSVSSSQRPSQSSGASQSPVAGGASPPPVAGDASQSHVSSESQSTVSSDSHSSVSSSSVSSRSPLISLGTSRSPLISLGTSRSYSTLSPSHSSLKKKKVHLTSPHLTARTSSVSSPNPSTFGMSVDETDASHVEQIKKKQVAHERKLLFKKCATVQLLIEAYLKSQGYTRCELHYHNKRVLHVKAKPNDG